MAALTLLSRHILPTHSANKLLANYCILLYSNRYMPTLTLPLPQERIHVDVKDSVTPNLMQDPDFQEQLQVFSGTVNDATNQLMNTYTNQAIMRDRYNVHISHHNPVVQLQLTRPRYSAELPFMIFQSDSRAQQMSIMRPLGNITVQGIEYADVQHLQRWILFPNGQTGSGDPTARYQEFFRTDDDLLDLLIAIEHRETGFASMAPGIAPANPLLIRDELADVTGIRVHEILGRNALAEGQATAQAIHDFAKAAIPV